MDASAVGMVLVGVAMLAALVAGVERWAAARQAEQTAMARESDAALRHIADTLGLTFMVGPETQHPVIGQVTAFGSAHGSHRGFHLRLMVVADDGAEAPLVFRTTLILIAPPGATFGPVESVTPPAHRLVVAPRQITIQPSTPGRARSASYEFFVVTDGAKLLALIDALCDLGARSLRRGDR